MKPQYIPAKYRQFRLVMHKCPRCGKERGIRMKDGVVITKNIDCHRCGSILVPIGGKVSKVNGFHLKDARAVV